MMRTAAMGKICAVLLSVGLLAGCASSGRSEQVVVLREDVVDLRERMNELQEQVAELTAHRIAFMSDRDGDGEIFVMNADGTDVYSTGQEGGSPSWGG